MPSSIQNSRLVLLSHCRHIRHFQPKSTLFSPNSCRFRSLSETLTLTLTPPPTSSILSIRESLISRQKTATELASDYLSRLKLAEPQLKSFIHVAEAEALKSAAELDSRIENGEEVGPLAGVLVGVKDNICTRDMASTGGSRILEEYRPAFDATAVRRLREKGAIVVGKTNLDEFGMGSTTEGSGFQVNVNLAGLPALVVPCGFVEGGSAGLPVGLQMIGSAFSEGQLLRVGHIFEQTLQNCSFVPPLCES